MQPLIQHNKATTAYPTLFVLDTEASITRETDSVFVHQLRLGVCLRALPPQRGRTWSEEWFTFTDPARLWEWIDQKVRICKTNLLIAHNAAYDVRLADISLLVRNHQWKCAFACIEDTPFILRFQRQEKNNRFTYLTVISTTNFAEVKLEDLGKAIGLEKMKVDFSTVSDDGLLVYCQRDVEILYEWFKHYLEFLKTHDLGKLSLTAASQAMHAYRHRFMRAPIVLNHDPAVVAIERKAYYGGRTECFRIGEVPTSPVYQLDVNSMYPFVMRNHQYPCAFLGDDPSPSLLRVARALKQHAVIADVELETDEPAYPYRFENKLIFPVGRFRTTLCTPELSYAINHFHLKRVHRLLWYQKADLFSSYVDYFYYLRGLARSEKRLVDEQIAKLFLNSLYGKFGERHPVWERVAEAPVEEVASEIEADGEEMVLVKTRTFLGNYEVLKGFKEGTNACVSIAAHVTAYARMYLWELIRLAGREHVFYVDTDSLFVDQEGYEKLQSFLDPNKLGSLKLVGKHNRLVINAPKSYETEFEAKRKGIRKDAREIRERVYEQDQWRSIKWSLRTGQLDRVVVEKIEKVVEANYSKGLVQPDGSVLPFRLGPFF